MPILVGGPMSDSSGRILVLCVDRDNDIGVKTGIKTPVIGREENLSAASRLALEDPEESDANAIFGAVRILDSLKRDADTEDYAVATIAGSESGGVRSDRKLRDELVSILLKLPSDNAILVTDGFSDQEVIPIVQSLLPIMSIHRVVVKHGESIEESWAVVSRYMRMITNTPYYSRWVLGVPGVVLVILAMLVIGDMAALAGEVFLLLLGVLLMIKGFSIERRFGALIFPSPPNLVRLFTAITAFIVIGLDVFQTYTGLYEELGPPVGWVSVLPRTVGLAMQYAVNLVVVAAIISLVGGAVYLYFTRDGRIWWSFVGVVATLWLREVTLTASEILLWPAAMPFELVEKLLFGAGFGIASTLITVFVTLKLGKRFERYFDKPEEQSDL
jgi:putative membrane protein